MSEPIKAATGLMLDAINDKAIKPIENNSGNP